MYSSNYMFELTVCLEKLEEREEEKRNDKKWFFLYLVSMVDNKTAETNFLVPHICNHHVNAYIKIHMNVFMI